MDDYVVFAGTLVHHANSAMIYNNPNNLFIICNTTSVYRVVQV